MELVLDIGNTRAKWATFKDGTLHSHGVFKNIESLPLDLLDLDPDIRVLVSTVSDLSNAADPVREKFLRILEFDHATPLPIGSVYKTPNTLGMDRIANAVGASTMFPNENVLVVDAGTCITMDLISATGVYLGGTISPGLSMRSKALNNYTSALPLVELAEPEQLVGQTTEQSILSGVLNGTIAELNGLVADFEAEFGPLKLVVTGGDMKWFEHVLKSETFADAFLTLRGLHAILQYNIPSA